MVTMGFKIRKKTPGSARLRDTPKPGEHGWPSRDIVTYEWKLYGYCPLTIIHDDKNYEIEEVTGEPADLEACRRRIKKAHEIKAKMANNTLIIRKPNIVEILKQLEDEEKAGAADLPVEETLENAVANADDIARELEGANVGAED